MRRLVLIGALGALLALLIGACGGTGSSDDTAVVADESVNAACEEKPQSGGSLIYDRQLELVTLNPRETKNGAGDNFAIEMVYSTLVRTDPEGTAEIVGALADKWDVSKDGLTYTFHLRPGIKFSDGSPITTEDVVWSMEQFRDPEVSPIGSVLAEPMKTVKATDDSTVVIVLKHPVAAFLWDISIYPAAILPKDKVEAEGDAFYRHPVSSGPFVMKELASGDHVTFEKNPYYYEKGKPYLDSMRWNFVSNANTRVLNLKSGEADIADGIPFNQIASLQSNSSLAVQLVESPTMMLLTTNTKVEALNDVHVRRAMSLAIDRELINETAFQSIGTVPNSVLQNFELNASDEEVAPFEYNVKKAEEEMARSKFADGFSITMNFASGLDYMKQMAILIQQQLGVIGIDVKLEELESATVTEKWINGEIDVAFPFPGTTSDLPVPDLYASLFAFPEFQNGFESFWASPEIESLVRKFTENTDESARAGEWKVIQEKFIEEMPSLNVLDIPFVNGHQSNICGTKTNSVGVDQLQETWVSTQS